MVITDETGMLDLQIGLIEEDDIDYNGLDLFNLS